MALDVARIQTIGEAAQDPIASKRSERPALEVVRKAGAGSSPRSWAHRVRALWSRRMSLEDQAVFTRQLALLLQTGNGLVPSIEALARQARTAAMKKELTRIHSELQAGKSLSEALERNQAAFGSVFVSLVRAGEATGALRESLEELSKMLDIQRGLRSKVREAMAYPTVLLCMMCGVLAFMMVFVLPRFAELFEGIEEELPVTTRFLLRSGRLLDSSSWKILPIILAAVVAAAWLWRSRTLHRAWDWLRFRIPLVGGLIEQAFMLRLFSSMGLLLGNHVPLLESIHIVRNLTTSSRYRGFFEDLRKNVEAGRGVAPAFQEARFLPDTVKLIVATGERSGALDKVMTTLAERYREDLEKGVRRASTLLEPLMIIVMGAFVATIAISFIVPIFKMSKAVH